MAVIQRGQQIEVHSGNQKSLQNIEDTGLAFDADVVHKSGNEEVGGVKAFTGANTHAEAESFAKSITLPAQDAPIGNAPTVNNNPRVKITTLALATAAGAVQDIILTSNLIVATSFVVAYIRSYSGVVVTDGIPQIFKVTPALGGVTIQLLNTGGAALNGAVIIEVAIFN